MQIQKIQPKLSEIELTIEVQPAEYQSYLEKAAVRISGNIKIAGFRPGKAPYAIVKQKVGEMDIYQEALENIISHFYGQAVEQEQLNTVGQPKIDVEKLAPGNPISFKATAALMPRVTLADWRSVKVKQAEVKVEPAEINRVIDDIRKLQAKETLADRPAKKGDRVEIDFTVSLDKVVIEGGQEKRYPLVLGDGLMVPGFEEQLEGLVKDQEKEFQLKFPAAYQNKMIAGRLCDFKVKLLSVYDRQLPELNDDWAKTVGAAGAEDLRSKIRKNIEDEKTFQEEQRVEIEMLERISQQSQFTEIPEVLINNEAHRMVHEFEDSIANQGIIFADYLKNLKKEEKDLVEEFKPKALDRVKTSLVIKEIAEAEKIGLTAEEIKQETERILSQVPGQPEAENNIRSEGYQQYLRTVMRNRKVSKLLKTVCVN